MHFEVCASSFAVWTFSDLMSLCRRWTERNKKHYISRSMVFARSTLTPTTSAKKIGKSENKIIQPGFMGIKKYIRCSWVLTINMNKGILPVKTTKSFCFRDPLKIENSRLESQVNFKFSNSCPPASLMLLISIHSVVVFPVRFGFACCFSCAVLHEQSLVVVCIFLGTGDAWAPPFWVCWISIVLRHFRDNASANIFLSCEFQRMPPQSFSATNGEPSSFVFRKISIQYVSFISLE